jgi:septum site-determining protein MinC
MSDQLVAIKGVRDGLLITLSPNEEWIAVTAELAARLDEKGDFFRGAEVTIDVGARPLRRDELTSVRALFERRSMLLQAVTSDSQSTLDQAIGLDLRVNGPPQEVPMMPNGQDLDNLPFRSQEDGIIGVAIRRTLRSGRTVQSDGHVLIYGDVNPGAEIVAAGDIVVWGRLRGIVHAGANGDESAVVCALDMAPTQLRIAGYITVSPNDKRRKPKPETALIRQGQIVVTTWDDKA